MNKLYVGYKRSMYKVEGGGCSHRVFSAPAKDSRAGKMNQTTSRVTVQS